MTLLILTLVILNNDTEGLNVTWLSNNNVYVGLTFSYFHPQYGLQKWKIEQGFNDVGKWCVKSSCNQFSFDAPTELIKYCLR